MKESVKRIQLLMNIFNEHKFIELNTFIENQKIYVLFNHSFEFAVFELGQFDLESEIIKEYSFD